MSSGHAKGGERRELEMAGAHLILDNTAMLDEVLLGPEEEAVTSDPAPSGRGEE